VQAVLQRKEEEDRQMKQLVQALQASLEKEKMEVNSLKEQVCGQLPASFKFIEPSARYFHCLQNYMGTLHTYMSTFLQGDEFSSWGCGNRGCRD
jgi:hypothetical protein